MSVIIYGAGQYGHYAYWEYIDKKEILCCIDRDMSIRGGCLSGTDIVIKGVEDLEQYPHVPVIIAVANKMGIKESLLKYGEREFIDYEPYTMMNAYVRDKQVRLNKVLMKELSARSVVLGDFIGKEIELPELSYLLGSSTVLDYAFIATCLKKFHCKSYMEIGSYVGDSVNLAAEYCDICYSLTASEQSPYSMKNWCRYHNMPDYSNRLIYKDNICQYECYNSQEFDYSQITDDIDCYFIDADHSYNGIFKDTKNVFQHRKNDSIVIWHDLKNPNYVAALAIKNAIGDEFKNVYAVDNNMCAVYIPEKFKGQIPIKPFVYTESDQPLYVYNTKLTIRCI